MKPAVMRKTAQVTALMLVISILLPVLAFAASGFRDTPLYKGGTVSGSVYSDVYSVNSRVYVYDPNGNLIGSTPVGTATYSVYNGVYDYSFSLASIGSGYSYVRLYGPVGDSVYGGSITDSVYRTVYRTNTDDGGGGYYGGGGGGGGGGSTSASENISITSDGTVNAIQLENSLEQYDVVTLTLSGESVMIPAEGIMDFTGNQLKIVKVTNAHGTYTIPVSVLNLSSLAGKVNVPVEDLMIKVTIAPASTEATSGVSTAATALGGQLASAVVDFSIVGVGADNATAAPDLGNHYLSRTLPLTGTVNAGQATGVLYNETTGQISFVPSTFSGSEAVLKRNGSSVYAVVQTNKTFADISGHWAEGYIKLLANKLVVDGVTDTSFQPERGITRAEFAALVVRSLGLSTTGSTSAFNDVSGSDWFSGVVAAAVSANIIQGYEDGTFRPNVQINREELSAMVVRALTYAGAAPATNAEQQATLLAKFNDVSSINWAKNEIAVAINAGIIDGLTDTTIGPRETATRAQSATMLKRLLTRANFINE